MKPAEWRKARAVIETFFQPGWKHKRIEFELTEAHRISEAGRKGGVASGEARRAKSKAKLNDRSTTDERSANDPPTKREALHSPSQREDSEAYASAADAAPEPVDEEPKAKLFRIGKTILVSFGVGEKRTGSLIGQWLKERNDPAGLLAAIEYARDQNVAEPVAYISTLLTKAKTNGHRGKQDLSAMCFAIADELRQQEHSRGDVRSDELFRCG
jgi:hypothetical protein